MRPINLLRNFFFVVLLATGSKVLGQDSSAKEAFDIKQSIEYAIANHPDIKNANLEIAIAQTKINELIAIGLPQINLSADLNKFIEIPTQFVPAEFFGGPPGSYAPVKFGQPWSSSAGISASQLLFDGSYLIGVQATKVYKELSQKNAEQLKIEMAVNITKTYYMVLVIQEKLKQLKGDLERIDKLRRDTKALFDKGFVEKVDIDRIDLNYNLLETAILQTTRSVSDGYNLLKFQLGMDLNTELELTEPLPDAEGFSSQVATTDMDYRKRIEYSILETQYKLTELDLKRYRSLQWPSLVAFGSYSANASRNEFNILESSYKWYPTSIVGASLKMPLFGGLKTRQQISQARLKLQMVENGSIKLEHGLELEYRNAVSKLNKGIEDLRMQKKNRDLAREIVRISKVKYDRGVGSSLEIVDAESSLRESETNYYSALLAAAVAKVELEKALGNYKF
ncbi:MAG: TolC family protein [Bacteroidota bacterium]|jgi:outer membrane protein